RRARRLHGRGVRRHRQHLRCCHRRPGHRDDPIVLGRLLRLRMDAGRDLHDPHPRADLPPDRTPRDAGAREVSMLRQFWEGGPRRDPNTIAYVVLLVAAIFFPILVNVITGGNSSAIMTIAADAGVYVLLAIGLNVVVGFAGLLDLGYAAFFAIGAYTVGLLASGQLSGSPLQHEFHVPFWVLMLAAMFIAAAFGAILGAPTLRLSGDYLAIVTLGFGEIV